MNSFMSIQLASWSEWLATIWATERLLESWMASFHFWIMSFFLDGQKISLPETQDAGLGSSMIASSVKKLLIMSCDYMTVCYESLWRTFISSFENFVNLLWTLFLNVSLNTKVLLLRKYLKGGRRRFSLENEFHPFHWRLKQSRLSCSFLSAISRTFLHSNCFCVRTKK